jgi:hypothetical protein
MSAVALCKRNNKARQIITNQDVCPLHQLFHTPHLFCDFFTLININRFALLIGASIFPEAWQPAAAARITSH